MHQIEFLEPLDQERVLCVKCNRAKPRKSNVMIENKLFAKPRRHNRILDVCIHVSLIPKLRFVVLTLE